MIGDTFSSTSYKPTNGLLMLILFVLIQLATLRLNAVGGVLLLVVGLLIIRNNANLHLPVTRASLVSAIIMSGFYAGGMFLPMKSISVWNVLTTLLVFATGIYFFLNLILFLGQESSSNRVSRKSIFMIFFIFMFVSLVYFWAYFPGILIIDSANQWSQAHSLTAWNDWHPVGNTFVIWMLTRIWDSPAIVVLFQITIFSLVMTYGYVSMIKANVSNKVTNSLIGFFIIFPYFNMLAITIVKDSLFSYSFTAVLITLVNMYLKNRGSNFDFAVLLLGNLGILFFRHNGFPILLASEIVFVFVFWGKSFWKLHIAMLLSLTIYLIISGPVYNRFNVIPAPKNEDIGMLIQMDAAVLLDKHSQISDSESEYFSSVFVLPKLADLYDPYSPDSLKFSNYLSYDSNKLRFIKKSMGIILDNPRDALRGYTNQTNMLWKIYSVQGMRPFFRQPYKFGKPFYFADKDTISKNKLHYKEFKYSDYGENHSNKQLRDFLLKYQSMFSTKLLNLFMPATFIFILAGLMVKLLIDRKFKFALLTTPFWLNIGILAVAIPAQDIRYFVMNYFALMPVIMILVNSNKKNNFAD